MARFNVSFGRKSVVVALVVAAIPLIAGSVWAAQAPSPRTPVAQASDVKRLSVYRWGTYRHEWDGDAGMIMGSLDGSFRTVPGGTVTVVANVTGTYAISRGDHATVRLVLIRRSTGQEFAGSPSVIALNGPGRRGQHLNGRMVLTGIPADSAYTVRLTAAPSDATGDSSSWVRLVQPQLTLEQWTS